MSEDKSTTSFEVTVCCVVYGPTQQEAVARVLRKLEQFDDTVAISAEPARRRKPVMR